MEAIEDIDWDELEAAIQGDLGRWTVETPDTLVSDEVEDIDDDDDLPPPIPVPPAQEDSSPLSPSVMLPRAPTSAYPRVDMFKIPMKIRQQSAATVPPGWDIEAWTVMQHSISKEREYYADREHRRSKYATTHVDYDGDPVLLPGQDDISLLFDDDDLDLLAGN